MRVFEDPEPDLDVPSVYGIANSLPRYELSRDIIDVLRSIYQGDPKTWSYELILNRHRCLVELGLMASKEDLSRKGNREAVGASTVIEVDDATDGEVPLSRKRKARAFETETSQARRNVVEVVDNYTVCSAPPLQRTLTVNTSGEVVLEGPSKSTQAPGGGDGGPYDSKRRFRELIGAPGVRIPNDALQNLSFYPSMGAQAVKKYFTPKWKEFSSHGELEDVLEEQRKLIAEASKSDKEHKQALEGLQAALDSARTAYEQMESDLKESDSNVLDLTKQLDNANAVQKFTVEALEAANKEKRRLLEEAKSRDEEIQSLRKDLESSENGRKEAKAGRKEGSGGKIGKRGGGVYGELS
ncbi:putative abhydrolase domain-containing protein [Abeliophyllum distichum]|uniref:Abhydrolase domain-containing protein n=1 Tax=Abeliophyllum distichum TaxID=126358 RepID=A0ABD1NTD8_9LAMI